MDIDYSKSLKDLGVDDFSRFLTREFETPLRDLESVDIRRVLIQRFGEEYLIPLSLERISSDLLEELDLLVVVLEVTGDFWDTNEDMRQEVDRLYHEVLIANPENRFIVKVINRDLKKAYQFFKEIAPYESLLLKNKVVRQAIQACYGTHCLRMLATIAAWKSIIIDEGKLQNPWDANSIDHLIKKGLIIKQYEGPYPAPLIIRLSKEFRKQLLKDI